MFHYAYAGPAERAALFRTMKNARDIIITASCDEFHVLIWGQKHAYTQNFVFATRDYLLILIFKL
jgi:hypothetical protein